MRWPGLAHLTTASALRLPMGSRLRRTLLEHAAHAAYEAWNRDDFREVARAAADPEIEVRLGETADLPVGLANSYYGPDGYCQAMEDWAGSWRSWHVEVQDVVEVEPDKVLVIARHIGEGLASGATVEQLGGVLYTFRRGKIVRVDAFPFSEEGVSAAVRAVVEGASAPERASRPD